MANENSEINDTLDNSEENDNKKGSAFPVRNINGIIPFIGRAYQKYGANDYHLGQLFADASDMSINSVKSLLSTAQQYGFVRNLHGKGYKITAEFTKIFHPENENEKNQTVVECLLKVPFYSDILSNNEGQVIPSKEGLTNKFMREHELKQNRAQLAADVLIQNLKDYDLINSRNVLILKSKTLVPSAIKIEDSKITKIAEERIEEKKDDESMIKIPIRLKNKRMAYLSFPEEYDDQDLIRIEKVIKAYVNIYNEKDDEAI